MADFKTHVSFSSLLGVGYAAAGWQLLELPPVSCILAGGLCGVSGMLPDLDSNSGVPRRESVAFTATVVPMLMYERFQQLQLDHETIVLAAVTIYLSIRMLVPRLLTHFTVHRGMFHSIPAMLIAGGLAYLACLSGSEEVRLFKAVGIMVGFASHLLLDEIYSIEWHHGRMRLKSSFGTAIKIWGKSLWANLLTFALLGGVSFLVFNDNSLMQHYGPLQPGAASINNVAGKVEDTVNRYIK
ncbi:MAG: metal-dependent hydrolase [Pirellulales bacterium]|nr:metal-dependent hydrolase [Planctomycetales bacterium]